MHWLVADRKVLISSHTITMIGVILVYCVAVWTSTVVATNGVDTQMTTASVIDSTLIGI